MRFVKPSIFHGLPCIAISSLEGGKLKCSGSTTVGVGLANGDWFGLTLADNRESEKLAAAQQPDVDFLDEFSYSFLSLNRGFLDNQINGRFPDNRQWLQTIHSGQSKASLLDCPLS
jgi:hypothetical protein